MSSSQAKNDIPLHSSPSQFNMSSVESNINPSIIRNRIRSKSLASNPFLSIDKDYRIIAILLVSLLSNAGSIVHILGNNDNIQNNDVLAQRQKIKTLIHNFKSLLTLSIPENNSSKKPITNHIKTNTQNVIIDMNSQTGAGKSVSSNTESARSANIVSARSADAKSARSADTKSARSANIGSDKSARSANIVSAKSAKTGIESVGVDLVSNMKNSTTGLRVKNGQDTSIIKINASHQQSFTSLWKLLAQILLIVFLLLGLYFVPQNLHGTKLLNDKIDNIKKIDNVKKIDNIKNKGVKIFHPYVNDVKWPKLDTIVSQLKSDSTQKDSNNLLYNYYPKTHIEFVQSIQPQLGQFVDEGRINLMHALQLIDEALRLKITINVDARGLKSVLKKTSRGPKFSFALDDVPTDLMPVIRRYYDKLILTNTDNNSNSPNDANSSKSTDHQTILNLNSRIPEAEHAMKVKTFFFDVMHRDLNTENRYHHRRDRNIESINHFDGDARVEDLNPNYKTLVDLDTKYLEDMSNYIRGIGNKDIDLIQMYSGSHFRFLNSYLRKKKVDEQKDGSIKKENDGHFIDDNVCSGSCISTFSDFTQQIIYVFRKLSVNDIIIQGQETKQNEIYKDLEKLKKTIDTIFLNSKFGLLPKSQMNKVIRDQRRVHENVKMFVMEHFYDIQKSVIRMIIDQIVNDFKFIIKNAPMNSEEMFLFRGTHAPIIKGNVQFKEGDIISDPAILSTSVDMETAMYFSQGVIFRIVIPPNSHTLLIPGISKFISESEVLLLPGSRFIVGKKRIVEHSFKQTEITIIDLIYIPDHPI